MLIRNRATLQWPSSSVKVFFNLVTDDLSRCGLWIAKVLQRSKRTDQQCQNRGISGDRDVSERIGNEIEKRL